MVDDATPIEANPNRLTSDGVPIEMGPHGFKVFKIER